MEINTAIGLLFFAFSAGAAAGHYHLKLQLLLLLRKDHKVKAKFRWSSDTDIFSDRLVAVAPDECDHRSLRESLKRQHELDKIKRYNLPLPMASSKRTEYQTGDWREG